jgi:hypothetical protein
MRPRSSRAITIEILYTSQNRRELNHQSNHRRAKSPNCSTIPVIAVAPKSPNCSTIPVITVAPKSSNRGKPFAAGYYQNRSNDRHRSWEYAF